MSWDVILTSGITSAIVGSLAGGAASYIVGRRLQLKDHEFQRQQSELQKAEADRAWLDSIRLNRAQKEVLQFCRANVSERYNLQSGSGTHSLLSCDTDERIEIRDMAIGNQLIDMESKGYINTLENNQIWHIFELTAQGRDTSISEES